MRRNWYWFAGSAPTLAAALLFSLLCTRTARGATVLERTVVHTFESKGTVVEEVRLRVKIDSLEDSRDWSRYHVALNENCTLESAAASVEMPDGSRVRVGSDRRDTLEIPASGSLHSSESYHQIDFPHLPIGAVIHLHTVVRAEPYFATGRIALVLDDTVASQRIEVRGAPAGWRWTITGRDDRFLVEERADGLLVRSEGLAAHEPPELALEAARRGPTLFYGWGNDDSWPEVAAWYEDLLAPLSRRSAPVRAAARAALTGVDGKGDRLVALTKFVQEKVRYVAVEVGVGGYRPTSPEETLERRWGDCKDKSLLLIDLLAEVGIEAHPTLIRASRRAEVDAAFPDPGQFNHLIVAVEAGQLDGAELAGVEAEGLFFLDPTQNRGGAVWLHPADQDQQVLVVRGADSSLVRTPLRPELEVSDLRVSLAVNATGNAAGGAGLELTGSTAAGFLDLVAEATPSEEEGFIRRLFGRLLPGAELGVVSWSPVEGDLPAISLSASVRLDGLVQGRPGGRSLRLPGLTSTPEAHQLAERETAVVVTPGRTRARWSLTLPDGWCPPRAGERSVANSLGSYSQKVSAEGGKLTVERSTELDQRWIEPADLKALQELSLAEHRALKRRLRLRCDED